MVPLNPSLRSWRREDGRLQEVGAVVEEVEVEAGEVGVFGFEYR